MQKSSLFSTSYPAFIVCRLLDDGYSDWYEMIFCCNFDLHFSNIEWYEWCWTSFHVFISHLCLLQRNVFLALLPTFSLVCLSFIVLSCVSCLYDLEINPLLVVSFAIIFSHSEGCIFTLLIVSFVMQKLLSLIKSHLLIFVFISLHQEVGHRRSYCDLRQRVSCLCFPLRVL